MVWIANTEMGLDPKNSVIKRLWCTYFTFSFKNYLATVHCLLFRLHLLQTLFYVKPHCSDYRMFTSFVGVRMFTVFFLSLQLFPGVGTKPRFFHWSCWISCAA